MRRIALIIWCLFISVGCTLPGPAPTLTSTATASPSPTPDLRVIDVDPRELILQLTDLPLEGEYTWAAEPYHYTNEKVLAMFTRNYNMSPEDQQTFLDQTGRLDGWYTVFTRTVVGDEIPVNIMAAVSLHTSAQGAQVHVTNYERASLMDNPFEEQGDALAIGDLARTFKETTLNPDGTINTTHFRLSFTYRNIYCKVTTIFIGDHGSLDIDIAMAQVLLARLLQQPLSDAVTFTP